MKIKVISSVLILCVAIAAFTGVTFAYFSDIKQTTNTYTAGNVYIELSEAAVKSDAVGNLVEDTTLPRILATEMGSVRDYGRIYPGQTLHKDPTVKNVGTENAWIAAKIIISDGEGDIRNVMGYPGMNAIDIEILLGGGLLDETVHVGTWNGFDNVCHNDRYAMVQIPNPTDGKYEFYFFMLEKFATGDSVELFDTLSIPDEWNNGEIKELVELEIKIQACAVQDFGFETCYDAMLGAFASQFVMQ